MKNTTVEKLPRKFKSRWIEELLNPENKQTKGVFRRGTSFCAIGVACLAADIDSKDIQHYQVADGQVPATFPDMLREKSPIAHAIIDLNDSGVPFEVIAGFVKVNF